MGFFKSKDDIPKLPKAPSLMDLPKLDEQNGVIPELPSFPNKSELHEKFSQQMVKSAISESPREEEVNSVPEIPYAIPHRDEVEEPVSTPKVEQVVPQKETIYVKIDQFSKAQKSILDIQSKISELSKSINELRKVKTKELEEINGWDEEMKDINSKLSRIDKGIFGEV